MSQSSRSNPPQPTHHDERSHENPIPHSSQINPEQPTSHGLPSQEQSTFQGGQIHEQPMASGSQIHEEPMASGSQIHEQPMASGSQIHEQPMASGSQIHEQPMASGSQIHEQPMASGSQIHEQPMASGSQIHEQPMASGSQIHEQPMASGSQIHEQPMASGSQIHEQPMASGSQIHEQPMASGSQIHEQPMASGSQIHEQPMASGSQIHEQPMASGSQIHEQPIASGSQIHGQQTSYSSLTPGQHMASSSQTHGQELSYGSQIPGQQRASTSQIHGQQMPYRSQIFGQQMASSSQTHGQEMSYRFQTPGQQMASSAQTHGGVMPFRPQTHGQQIASSSQIHGQEMTYRSRSQFPGQQMASRFQTHGQQIASSSQTHGPTMFYNPQTQGQRMTGSFQNYVQPMAYNPHFHGQSQLYGCGIHGRPMFYNLQAPVQSMYYAPYYMPPWQYSSQVFVHAMASTSQRTRFPRYPGSHTHGQFSSTQVNPQRVPHCSRPELSIQTLDQSDEISGETSPIWDNSELDGSFSPLDVPFDNWDFEDDEVRPEFEVPDIITTHWMQAASSISLHQLYKARNEPDPRQVVRSYLKYFFHEPDMSLITPKDMDRFVKVTAQTAQWRINAEQDSQALKCYLEGLKFFPTNCFLLNAIGTFLFNKEEIPASKIYLQAAADLGDITAQQNLLHVMWFQLPRWHFRMLNDKRRNQCYQKAINKAIDKGLRSIIDIGSGTGILSMIAAQHKDVKVAAYEACPILYDMSKKLLEEHQMDNVVVYNKYSALEAFAPIPCELLVTEIFDVAIFGEDCLLTLMHATSVFRNSPKLTLIPAKAVMYARGFECDRIANKFRYSGNLPQLNLNGKSTCVRTMDMNPYDAEFLDHYSVRFLTPAVPFLEIDFDNVLSLIAHPGIMLKDFKLVTNTSGRLDALAVWFDLKLDDDITISTRPRQFLDCSWEQAIFPISHPKRVVNKMEYNIRPGIECGRLVLNFPRPIAFQCNNCYIVRKEIIAFLNDTELVDSIVRLADTYPNNDFKVIDYNVVPLFGLLMAKRGATVYVIYSDPRDLDFFDHLLELNDIAKGTVMFCKDHSMLNYGWTKCLRKIDIIFPDLVRPDGSWYNRGGSDDNPLLADCIRIPHKVFLKAQLISSEYLDHCNKIDDNNALNLGIGKYMNEFSGTEHPNIDYIKPIVLSKVVTFDVTDYTVYDYSMETKVKQKGAVNGVYYWFEFQYSPYDTVTFSTLNSTYYLRTCTYLSEPKQVEPGDKLVILVNRAETCLKVSIQN